MELYLRTLLRQVDSSLADEWERMRDPDYQPRGRRGGRGARSCGRRGPRRPTPDITRDTKRFTAAIRTRVFTFLRAWSIGDHAGALAALDDPPRDGDGDRAWTAERPEGGARGLPRRARARCASTPRRATSATRTSVRTTGRRRGASSRCWSIPRCTMTGWRSSRWTSRRRARPASRCSGSAVSGASPDGTRDSGFAGAGVPDPSTPVSGFRPAGSGSAALRPIRDTARSPRAPWLHG